MKDILIFPSLFAGWIVLNLWVLPLFGIRTCMSGACRVPQVEPLESHNSADKSVRVNQSVREQERP